MNQLAVSCDILELHCVVVTSVYGTVTASSAISLFNIISRCCGSSAYHDWRQSCLLHHNGVILYGREGQHHTEVSKAVWLRGLWRALELHFVEPVKR